MVDIVVACAAIAALVVAVIGVSSTFYPLYRALVDSNKVSQLEDRVSALEIESNRHEYISDEIANVLYDLYNLLTFLKAYVELQQEGLAVDEASFDRANVVLDSLEKHFLELGLFSVDEVRRRSVQQSLAARYGDIQTLEIMSRLMEGSIGKGDDNLTDTYRTLRKRLTSLGSGYDSTRWTGRPSGGAF